MLFLININIASDICYRMKAPFLLDNSILPALKDFNHTAAQLELAKYQAEQVVKFSPNQSSDLYMDRMQRRLAYEGNTVPNAKFFAAFCLIS